MLAGEHPPNGWQEEETEYFDEVRAEAMAVTENGKPLQHIRFKLRAPVGSEVLVRTTHAGLCHSDLHQIDGFFGMGKGKKLDLTRRQCLPFCVGHEIEGEVIAVGKDARGKVDVGRVYAIYPWGGCGLCHNCGSSSENLCSTKHANDLGNGKNLMGGFSSHVIVRHYKYCFDRTGLGSGVGAIMMCSGLTAFSALRKVGPCPPGDILIIGLGGVGLQAHRLAKTMFGGLPKVLDKRKDILRTVEEIDGCKGHIFNANDQNVVNEVRGKSVDGLGLYAAVDFVGTSETFALSSKVIRRGGRIIQVGLLGGKMSMPLPIVTLQSISIHGSLCGTLNECREMFAFLKSTTEPNVPVTVRSIKDVNAAIKDLRAGNIVGRCILEHNWESLSQL